MIVISSTNMYLKHLLRVKDWKLNKINLTSLLQTKLNQLIMNYMTNKKYKNYKKLHLNLKKNQRMIIIKSKNKNFKNLKEKKII